MIEKVKFDGFKYIDGGVCAAQGFKANGIQCGLAHEGATVGKKVFFICLFQRFAFCIFSKVMELPTLCSIKSDCYFFFFLHYDSPGFVVMSL